LEVVRALCLHEQIDEGELKRLEETKRENRGGFTEGLFLKETQEVPIIRLANETPDLFREVEPAGTRDEGVEIRQGKSLNLGPVPLREGPALMIPLVPPNPQKRHFGHMFHFRAAGVTLNVRFREKDIVVEVAPLRTDSSSADPRQLLLFNDD
jgi:hypothetical protein